MSETFPDELLEIVREFVLSRSSDIIYAVEDLGLLYPVLDYFTVEVELEDLEEALEEVEDLSQLSAHELRARKRRRVR